MKCIDVEILGIRRVNVNPSGTFCDTSGKKCFYELLLLSPIKPMLKHVRVGKVVIHWRCNATLQNKLSKI